MKSKKANMTLGMLAPTVIILGVAAIITIIMANIVTEVRSDQCASGYTYNTSGDFCMNSTGQWVAAADTRSSNISGEGLKGIAEMAGFYDILGLVIIASIVISVLLGAFLMMKT